MSKISELANAVALGGTEQIPGVQSGGNVKITPAQLTTYAQQAAGSIRVIAASAEAVTAPASDTNENILATITIPAGAMGPNGILRLTTRWTATNNANAKTLRHRFSGISGTVVHSTGSGSYAARRIIVEIANRNSESSQIGGLAGQDGFGSSGSTWATSTVDTTSAQTIVVTAQKATGTDTVTLEGYVCEILKPT